MAQPWEQHRWHYGYDRWYEGWYQKNSGLWWHSGWPQALDQDRAPWYPREAVFDANGNRVDRVAAVAAGDDVEWEATMQKWGAAAMGSDDDRSGLFDHSLTSQNEVIADAEEEGNRGAESDAEEEGNREDADDEDAAPWRYLAVEYNRCDDEEAEAGDEEAEAGDRDSVTTEQSCDAPATAADDDSWTTEQSRDAAESPSSTGSWQHEPSRARGRRGGGADAWWTRRAEAAVAAEEEEAADAAEEEEAADAAEDAAERRRFEQMAGGMLETLLSGDVVFEQLTPLDLPPPQRPRHHQAAPPPPSGI